MTLTITGVGVLYLTPDAPVSGGTGFFRSKIDGSLTSTSHDLGDGVYQNMSLWEKVGEVGNVYNRLILFRADQWHTSLDYFGDDLHNGLIDSGILLRHENICSITSTQNRSQKMV